MEGVASPSALCDLHIHLGASVAPHIMWSIAHAQGFKLPVKDYWEFKEMITVDPNKCQGLDDYLRILHEWTERIQSSPAAVERSVYEIIGKEYRSSRVEQIELRFNPMKRNQKEDETSITSSMLHCAAWTGRVLSMGSRPVSFSAWLGSLTPKPTRRSYGRPSSTEGVA